MKQWGFENTKKYDKKSVFLNIWKGSFLLIIFISFLSFFSILNETVYAGKKDFLKKLVNNNYLELSFNYNIPSYILKLIKDYKDGKNILKNDKIGILFVENHLLLFLNLLGYGAYKNEITYIYNQFKPYKKDIFKILGENEKKTYLLIFENVGEERPDGGFFGSFAKLSFSGGHLIDFKIYDSYYLLWKYCGTSGKDWFETCKNRSNLSLENNIFPFNKVFPKTTFINANVFGFTELNAKRIIKHYNQVFPEKISGVVFIKSSILKYLLPDGDKQVWKMEVLNALSKSTGKYKDDKNLKGLGGAKTAYLEYINSFDKKKLFLNFIKNYKKIVSSGQIRVYFSGISEKFENYLKKSNLIFYKKPFYGYMFFYNLGFNKVSKFVDHIIIIDNKVYVNNIGFKLSKGKHIIKYFNVLNIDENYYKFLKQNKVPKTSYLYSKKLVYKTLLILPENCKKEGEDKNKYVVECN